MRAPPPPGGVRGARFQGEALPSKRGPDPFHRREGGGVPFPPEGGKGIEGMRGRGYQTRQRFSGAMGAPVLHWKASWNSGMLTTTPLAR